MYKLFADSEGEMTTEQLAQANKSTLCCMGLGNVFCVKICQNLPKFHLE